MSTAERLKTYNELRESAKQLVRDAVSDACDFLNDIMCDPEARDMEFSINALIEQSVTMCGNILDPIEYKAEVSDAMKQAIREYVFEYAGFAVVGREKK